MSPVSEMAVYRRRVRSNTHLWLFQARGCAWGAPDPDFGYGDGPSNAAVSRCTT
jgi:hypothetical protein